MPALLPLSFGAMIHVKMVIWTQALWCSNFWSENWDDYYMISRLYSVDLLHSHQNWWSRTVQDFPIPLSSAWFKTCGFFISGTFHLIFFMKNGCLWVINYEKKQIKGHYYIDWKTIALKDVPKESSMFLNLWRSLKGSLA